MRRALILIAVMAVPASGRADFLAGANKAVFSTGSDQQRVYALGNDGHVYRRISPYPGTGAQWTDLGAPTGASLTGNHSGLSGVTYVTAAGTSWAIYVVSNEGSAYQVIEGPGGGWSWESPA